MDFNRCNKDILISPFMIEELSVFELIMLPLLLLMFVIAMIWVVVDVIKYEIHRGK